MNGYEEALRAVETVRDRLGTEFPKQALVLGSGFGAFAEHLTAPQAIAYSAIPGFPVSTVHGHAGQLVVGKVGQNAVALMQGRVHAYEGHSPAAIAAPIRALRGLGVETLILTNASGGLTADFPAGTLALIEDHINFSGVNPLVGPNDARFGPRFFDMSEAYDRGLRESLRGAAARAGVALKSGVYLYVRGPNFETPAEVRMFAQMGAHMVGMSTVPECLVARHCGMTVAGLSLVTNPAAGLGTHPLSHDETLAVAQSAYARIAQLLLHYISG